MILQVIAVFDRAVAAFMQPMFIPHKGAAVRSFTDWVNDSNSEFSKHPEDYELYLLAEYDDQKGRFNMPEVPDRLCRAQDVLVTKN